MLYHAAYVPHFVLQLLRFCVVVSIGAIGIAVMAHTSMKIILHRKEINELGGASNRNVLEHLRLTNSTYNSNL